MGPDQTQKLISGALITGGGVGLLGALYDLIRSNARERKALNGEGTLKLTMPPPDGLPKQAVLTELVGGMAVGVGGAALAQKLYQMLRKKQLKQETEDATQAYLGGLQQQAKIAHEKSAGGNWLWEMLKDSPRDAFMIPMLAGGVGTYGVLNHAFPDNQSEVTAEKVRPKKIVIDGYGTVIADGPGDGPLAKAASATFEYVPTMGDNVKAAADLFMTLCETEFAKEASLLPVLGGLWIYDRQALEKAAREDVENTILHAAGGEKYWADADFFEKRAAAQGLLSSPLFRSSVSALVAGELNEANPALAKMASWVSLERPDLDVLLTKYASVWSDIVATGEALKAIGENYKSASLEAFTGGKSMDTLDNGAAPTDAGGEVEEADPVYQGKQDPIDAFLAGNG